MDTRDTTPISSSSNSKQSRWYQTHWRGRINGLMCSTRRRAKVKGLPHSISVDAILARLEDQEFRCATTGTKLELATFGKSSHNPLSPSIDRIASNLGYTPENIQVVCLMYNNAKNTATHDEVVMFARALIDHEDSK